MKCALLLTEYAGLGSAPAVLVPNLLRVPPCFHRAWRLRANPSGVLGPVERPPWSRQRCLPRIAGVRQGLRARVRAPQRGRLSGSPRLPWRSRPRRFTEGAGDAVSAVTGSRTAVAWSSADRGSRRFTLELMHSSMRPDATRHTKRACVAKSLQTRTRNVARPAGLEPATPGLEGRCSIHLSYGREREIVQGTRQKAQGRTPPCFGVSARSPAPEPPTLCPRPKSTGRRRAGSRSRSTPGWAPIAT